MRKIFISAGHSNKPGKDQGAAGNGFIEGQLAVELRNLLVSELKSLGITPVGDADSNVLKDSITFFKNLTAKDSIVLDIHWNAGPPSATGVEVLIPSENSPVEKNLAKDLADEISKTLSIPLRGAHAGLAGVKTESDSHHGRLGWMRLTGENVLLEMCFISSKSDMESYQKNKIVVAKNIAKILYDYANDNGLPQTIGSTKTYKVKSGDTLSKIAVDNKTSVNELKRLNNLTSDTIKINQVLIVN
jgi:N-acetylmuramoyl-L-alanine amidase